MKLRTIIAAAAMTVSPALTAPTSANEAGRVQVAQAIMETVSAYDVEAALHDLGAYDIDIGIDSYDDPEISATYDGLFFTILFYGCDGDYCQKFQYRGIFEASRSEAQRVVEMQNAELVFGKAYIDDNGDAIVEHPVFVEGGVTDEFLFVQADLWFEILRDFANELGY